MGDPRWVTKIRTGDFGALKDFAPETMGAWRTSVDPALTAVPGIAGPV